MAIYNDVVVTQAGIQLLRDVSITDRKLSAVNAVTCESTFDDPGSIDAIDTIPTLWIKQNLSYSLYSHNKNQFVLEVQLTNKDVTAPYTLNTIGLYVSDGLQVVLLAIITAQEADTIPAESSYPVSLNFKAIITLDSQGSVQINASYAGAVTMEQLRPYFVDINTDIPYLTDIIEKVGAIDTLSQKVTQISDMVDTIDNTVNTIKTAISQGIIKSIQRGHMESETSRSATRVQNIKPVNLSKSVLITNTAYYSLPYPPSQGPMFSAATSSIYLESGAIYQIYSTALVNAASNVLEYYFGGFAWQVIEFN